MKTQSRSRKPAARQLPSPVSTDIAATILTSEICKKAVRALLEHHLGEWKAENWVHDEIQFFKTSIVDNSRAFVGYDYTRREAGPWQGTILGGCSGVAKVYIQSGKVVVQELSTANIDEFEAVSFRRCRNNPTWREAIYRDFDFQEDSEKETVHFVAEMWLYAEYPDWTREHVETRTVRDETITFPKVVAVVPAETTTN